jgi:undecaprenyl-diphosphatase
MTVVRDHDVPAWEAEVFEAVNDLPDQLWPAVWVPMQLGSFGGSIGATALTFAVTRDRRVALAAAIGSQAAFWSAKGVKALVDRGRPAAFFTDAHVRETARGVGYVSGHAAVAFSLAAALAPSMPRRWRPIAVAGASYVGVARLYAGAHLPLDVVGGAGLGVLTGTLARWATGLGGAGLPATVR